VRDLAFYNHGCHEPKGVRKAVVPVRRLLRRMLRPAFQRLVEILTSLCDRLDAEEHATHALRHEMALLRGRQDRMAGQLQTAVALGWDYVALTRRLAVLEDRVESLLPAARPGETESAVDGYTSIPFPVDEPRAKVC
jgi:hypothetical protein